MATHANSTSALRALRNFLPPHPSPSLPAVVVATPELRALTVYDEVPRDCGSFVVPDNGFAPHLRAGEKAVIDPDDREPVAGELFVVTISDPRVEGGKVLELVQIRPRPCNFVVGRDRRGQAITEPGMGWMLHFELIRHRTLEQTMAALRAGQLQTCDGPLTEDRMREKIVGRVVGVMLGGADVRPA